MALHDFRCRFCGTVRRDVNVPIAVGASRAQVICFCLGTPEQMQWIPQIGRMDYGPAGGAGFKAFAIEEEVRGKPQRIEIDSVAKLRKVEREFETHARNGEGRPLVWRDYHQDRSNRDVHTLSTNLADPHGVQPGIAAAKASGRIKGERGEAVTKVHGTI